MVSKNPSCMLNVQEKMSCYTGSVANHDLSLSLRAKNKSTGDLKKNFNGKNGRDSLSCAGAAEFERQASYPELRLEILYEIEFFSCGK
jgi:hypothetical protein